ncbi:SagB/ThcOx family dehydrogenase [Streptomyces sp. NPDC014746]|uniref:SagB/ThcOx family dehydrogenase n=1 Tax=Streptomyces sp. NPDC014746 TaxID=3364904 RepID=UPI003703023B
MNGPLDLLFVADRRFVRSDDGLLDAGTARPADLTSLADRTAGLAALPDPAAPGSADGTRPGPAYGTTNRTTASTVGVGVTGPAPALDPEVSRLLSGLRRGTYLDYASDEAMEVDESIMRSYLDGDPPPPTETPWSGTPAWLPHPAYGTRAPRTRGGPRTADVARLLLSGFGHLRTASFLALFDVVLKPVPSKGARHPFDAYITVGQGAAWVGLAEGAYRYVPSLHALECLDAPSPDERSGDGQDETEGVGLIVTAVFERVQWRYREPAGYRDLYLDLGHVTGTLGAVAEDVRLSLTPVARPPAGLVGVPLESEIVAAYRLGERT